MESKLLLPRVGTVTPPRPIPRRARVRLPRSLLSPLFDQDATTPKRRPSSDPERRIGNCRCDQTGRYGSRANHGEVVAVVRSTALWPLGGSSRGLNFSAARLASEEPCRPDASE